MTKSAAESTNWHRVLRWAAILFAIAVTAHAIDHLRRGMTMLAPAVMIAGWVQIVLAVAAIVLVFLGNRWAPHVAIVVGFVSAIGFTAAHLLPTWGFFSDSFINAPPSAHITWFSWVSALFEIGADTLFGLAGIAALRSTTPPASLAEHTN